MVELQPLFNRIPTELLMAVGCRFIRHAPLSFQKVTSNEKMIGHDQDGGEPPGLSQLAQVEPPAQVQVEELNG